MNNKVSIIVPCFNASKTIDRCIASIVNQSYTNIEIITVDDGSKDNTLELLNIWATKDDRIKVIHTINSGLSSTRNEGLRVSTGEYITFIDADDYYGDRHIEKLLEAALKTNSEVVQCSRKDIYKDKEELFINDDNSIISGIDALCEMYRKENNTSVMVWDKLYKKDILPDKYFDPPYHRYSEDSLFNSKVLLHTNRFTKISYVGYNYDHRSSLITSSKYNKYTLNIIYSCDEIEKYINNISLSNKDKDILYKAYISHKLREYGSCIGDLLLHGDYKNKDKEDYEYISLRAKEISNKDINTNLSIKDRLKWKMYFKCPWLFVKLKVDK